MRLRRLSAVFWATCIAVLLFILYVVTDLSFKLPSVKPFQEAHDTPWNSFEKKLHNIEKELTHHEAVVEEIRSAVNHIVEQSQELEVLKNPNEVSARKSSQGSSKSPSKLCPIELMGISPVTQMLQLYENTSFLDVDGGVWKQGWSIEYDQRQWDSETKLKVFIIPHSHNDPGWLKTFEDYYKTQTRSIFKNMVEKLPAESERKFIWAETSYLSLWWNDATTKQKAAFESLLRSGHIEIVTGGWVMNDEANTHWLSVIQQLTVGHQWLIDHLGYIPKNAWAIDPFGHSSAQPYLLKLAGFENSVIQRVHYIVKKELALQKSLEFRWRQTWDGSGATELFTHMMPFYSYDVPHSCGPDPKICCQFDFRRLPGFGLNCPWNIPPKKITPKNVHERASLILDQWRKKSQLYKTNVIFFPLGDDFRYDQANEWDEQYKNYEAIINYINAKDEFHAEVQFGTLKDYFKAVHAELPINKFPSVAGDFFTYADRNQHYWSGYYTTRPFYKNMDRALLAYVRAAEIITGQAVSSQKVTSIVALQLRDKLVLARQALALFQHHDGITGTARNEVRADYAHKMIAAIHYCQTTIQQAAYYLLNQPKLQEHEREDIYFHIDDEWFQHDKLSSTGTIVMDSITSRRNLLFYNPLMFRRTEVVTIIVNTPKIQITDSTGTPIPIQISPVIGGVKLWLVAEKFKISFVAHIDPMSIATYVIKMIDEANRVATYSSLRIYNAPHIKENAHKMFEIEEAGQHKGDISLGQNDMMVTLDEQGMLKLVRTEDGTVIPIKLDYITYSSRTEQDNNSGAYLFMPKGEGEVLPPVVGPAILVIQGDFVTSVHVEVDSTLVGNMIVTIRLINNPSLPQTEIEISNTFLIDQTDDAELAMRFTTDILNSEVFYTDVNGMQMTKRKHFSKLPIQANYYPMPAAAYIEDKDLRLTVLTSTPLGVASLLDGQIEIMQDRRLRKDDNRGLNQPILDNIWTRHTFKLIVEKNIPCQSSLLSSHSGSGFLTLGAHVSQQMLLQPLIKMHYATQEKSVPVLKKRKNPVNAADLVLASFNSHISAKTKDERKVQGMGLTFQRVHLTSCYGESNQIQSYYPVSNGQFRISDIADLASDQVYDSTLTYVNIKEPLSQGILNICPMQIRSVFVNQTLKHT